MQLSMQILRAYARENISKTRIVLLSDGEENADPRVADVLPGIIEEGITIDTILYG